MGTEHNNQFMVYDKEDNFQGWLNEIPPAVCAADYYGEGATVRIRRGSFSTGLSQFTVYIATGAPCDSFDQVEEHVGAVLRGEDPCL